MARAFRAGWTRLSPPGRKLIARWRHDASGWQLRHCGHQTAIWPYFAEDPNRVHPDDHVVTPSGRGFATLKAGMSAIEDLVAGRAELSDENCVPGVFFIRRLTS